MPVWQQAPRSEGVEEEEQGVEQQRKPGSMKSQEGRGRKRGQGWGQGWWPVEGKSWGKGEQQAGWLGWSSRQQAVPRNQGGRWDRPPQRSMPAQQTQRCTQQECRP